MRLLRDLRFAAAVGAVKALMPEQTGIEAAEELAERWEGPAPFPQVVFVTACDDYAVQAFEQAAADYVLKPVNEARLAPIRSRSWSAACRL